MVCAVLLHGDGPLKWSVTNGQFDVTSGRLLDTLGSLISTVACNNLSIDLCTRVCGEYSDKLVGTYSLFIQVAYMYM